MGTFNKKTKVENKSRDIILILQESRNSNALEVFLINILKHSRPEIIDTINLFQLYKQRISHLPMIQRKQHSRSYIQLFHNYFNDIQYYTQILFLNLFKIFIGINDDNDSIEIWIQIIKVIQTDLLNESVIEEITDLIYSRDVHKTDDQTGDVNDGKTDDKAGDRLELLKTLEQSFNPSTKSVRRRLPEWIVFLMIEIIDKNTYNLEDTIMNSTSTIGIFKYIKTLDPYLTLKSTHHIWKSILNNANNSLLVNNPPMNNQAFFNLKNMRKGLNDLFNDLSNESSNEASNDVLKYLSNPILMIFPKKYIKLYPFNSNFLTNGDYIRNLTRFINKKSTNAVEYINNINIETIKCDCLEEFNELLECISKLKKLDLNRIIENNSNTRSILAILKYIGDSYINIYDDNKTPNVSDIINKSNMTADMTADITNDGMMTNDMTNDGMMTNKTADRTNMPNKTNDRTNKNTPRYLGSLPSKEKEERRLMEIRSIEKKIGRDMIDRMEIENEDICKCILNGLLLLYRGIRYKKIRRLIMDQIKYCIDNENSLEYNRKLLLLIENGLYGEMGYSDDLIFENIIQSGYLASIEDRIVDGLADRPIDMLPNKPIHRSTNQSTNPINPTKLEIVYGLSILLREYYEKGLPLVKFNLRKFRKEHEMMLRLQSDYSYGMKKELERYIKMNQIDDIETLIKGIQLEFIDKDSIDILFENISIKHNKNNTLLCLEFILLFLNNNNHKHEYLLNVCIILSIIIKDLNKEFENHLIVVFNAIVGKFNGTSNNNKGIEVIGLIHIILEYLSNDKFFHNVSSLLFNIFRLCSKKDLDFIVMRMKKDNRERLKMECHEYTQDW
eukprot:GHVP01029235.1.p1 GENE.GHVP01029235.1~~GHVP01029235.1.p1  ORF type:complete len:842 (-),score=106.37 GHVP01029235.1:140-2665(-)